MDLLAALAFLTLVVASAAIVALEAVLGRTPAPSRLPAHAHARGRAAHPASHARRSPG